MLPRLVRWLFPHPSLTVLLTLVWVVLQKNYGPGMIVFGLILGTIIPIVTAAWWPDRPISLNIPRFLSYAVLVLWDIVVANVEVAWIVLTKSNQDLKPAWIAIPLDLVEPEAITILAGTITLTPGTVSADLSDEGHSLLVHVLHTEDPDAVRDDIKSRYERRLLEIFA